MKKKITITLYTSEILHDVENTAFLTGKAKRGDGNEQQVSLVQASEDAEDSDRIMRSIGSAYNTLFSAMSEYIVDSSTTSDNALWDRSRDLVINLTMPSNFNLAETDSISSSAATYVANLALGDWFSITSPDAAETYYTSAAAALKAVRYSLEQRVRPMRLNPEEVKVIVYWGVVQEDFIASEKSVSALKQIKASNREYDMTIDSMDYDKICYSYPKIWGEITSIKDDNNFDYIDSFSQSVVTIAGEDYFCYLLTSPVSLSNKIVLKFR